jgi:ketosteroid isomerase-like protein/mannose-6-phosphate isomerase-like protein (cupin superfamily)
MRRFLFVPAVAAGLSIGCAQSANPEQGRASLTAIDREWSQTVKDPDKFVSYYATDASLYMPGTPILKGQDAIKKAYVQLSSTPGFSLQWAANKADIGSSGDIGYTAGTYQMGEEKGKYITVWKKQTDGSWKVTEDILNSDAPPAPATGPHVMLPPAKVTWGPAPPSLPPGMKMAVISGDPGSNGPFVIRGQLPANYTIAPHWHPTDEHVTVLAGTIAMGMGDKVEKGEEMGPGGYAAMPAQMHHYLVTKTAATVQVHGMGPFAINYVNPADDPSKK